MDEKSEVEKIDEVMLPGFRFHPTDEELVGFYLKRKIQQRTLSIELIKQLDIYKYDPWDLPKMATTGEKEWYFYCPRDRKYRNSARPNRVTGAGFWKATGTDRPIYSSEGNKCIGLKKSLVFYKGRAAKGIKTDWMMHEFRLPSLTDSGTPKRFINDKTIPANESWAICRIFKKTSSTTLRVPSHSWVSTLPEPVSSNHIPSKCCQATHLNSQSMIVTTENSSGMHLNYNNDHIEQTSTVNPLAFSYHKPINPFPCKPSQLPISNWDLTSNFLLSPLETSAPAKCTVDFSSILLNMSSSMLGDYGKVGESIGLDDSQEHCNNGFSLDILPQEMQLSMSNGDETVSLKSSNMAHMDSEWEIARNIGFPFSSQMNMTNIGAWKPSVVWDSLPFPTEVSASFSTAKCYT